MQVKTNSLKAWVLASRPKTLAGAVAPVLVGIAYGVFTTATAGAAGKTGIVIVPSVLCILFAVLMQIDANFINDYFDWKKGADKDGRLGPERACTQGWITPGAMKKGIATVTAVSFLIGLPLIYYGGWPMAVVGIFCILGAFLYTTRLSYLGFGDIMVVLFFGIIPVFFTYHVIIWRGLDFPYMLSLEGGGNSGAAALGYIVFGWIPLLSGLAVGLVTDNLLIVNNYRDRTQDAENGKKTLVVRCGAKAAEWVYLLNGVFATVLCMLSCGAFRIFRYGCLPENIFPFHLVVPLLFLPFLFATHRKMIKINHGKELNAVLCKTSRNILIYSLIFVITITLTALPVWYNG